MLGAQQIVGVLPQQIAASLGDVGGQPDAGAKPGPANRIAELHHPADEGGAQVQPVADSRLVAVVDLDVVEVHLVPRCQQLAAKVEHQLEVVALGSRRPVQADVEELIERRRLTDQERLAAVEVGHHCVHLRRQGAALTGRKIGEIAGGQ